MAYTPGWNPDRQSRVARQSQQQDHAHGPLPLVSRGGAPTVTTFDYPNPSFIPLRIAQYAALRATNLGEANGLLPELLNQDRVFDGAGQVPSFEQQQALPPIGPRRPIENISYIDPSEIWLAGKDLFFGGAGQGPNYAYPNPTLRQAPAASIYDPGLNLTVLISALPLPAGAQSTALPPRAAARAADLITFVDASENWLFGTDAIATGAQLSGNAPAAPRREVDYTHTADLIPNLIGQDAMAAGAQISGPAPAAPQREADYTWTQDLIPNLVGQDAMVTGVQSVALPPRAAPRGQDFWLPVPLALLTTVVQQIPYGTQVTDALAPRAAARARDYTWTQALIPNLIGQDQLNVGAQRFELAPSPAPLRARDYSISEAFPLTLISQDRFNAGKQSFDLPPIAALRSRDYSFTPPVNLACLTTVVQQIPYGAQSTDSLPPRAAARARDYSIAASFPLELNGKDQFFSAPGQVPAFDWSYLPPKPRYQQGTGEAVQDLLSTLLATVAIPGKQSTDLPPRAAPRALDYTLLASLIPELIGQDAMAVGVQLSGNAPSGARRAVDYSFLASFPLELIGRDAMTAGDQLSDLPYPRGAARARDYTIAAGYLLELIGQDAMIAGDQWTELGPRGAARARDYSLTASYALPNTTPQRDLSYVLGEPRSAWRVRAPRAGWETNEPTSTWRIRPPQE